MATVFVVSAGVDYEGSTPIKVFPKKDAADEFVKSCKEYELSVGMTTWGYYEDDSDMVLDHPAKQCCAHDYYEVDEVQFGEDS